jgi:hypothetical protein
LADLPAELARIEIEDPFSSVLVVSFVEKSVEKGLVLSRDSPATSLE